MPEAARQEATRFAEAGSCRAESACSTVWSATLSALYRSMEEVRAFFVPPFLDDIEALLPRESASFAVIR